MNLPEVKMTDLEKKQAIEILRLRSLCRYAAIELRALDDIIAQRHPQFSGLENNLINRLEEKLPGGYIKKYPDLISEHKDLLRDTPHRDIQSEALCDELADLDV